MLKGVSFVKWVSLSLSNTIPSLIYPADKDDRDIEMVRQVGGMIGS
jgi:hypothetical protein